MSDYDNWLHSEKRRQDDRDAFWEHWLERCQDSLSEEGYDMDDIHLRDLITDSIEEMETNPPDEYGGLNAVEILQTKLEQL